MAKRAETQLPPIPFVAGADGATIEFCARAAPPEIVKDGLGPDTSGDVVSVLAMPPAPSPGRRHFANHWAMPMPPDSHP